MTISVREEKVAEVAKASRKRSKLILFASILKDIALEPSGPTQIMLTQNLSYALVREYMKEMIRYSLARKVDVDGKECYLATEKGMRFVSSITHTLEFLR